MRLKVNKCKEKIVLNIRRFKMAKKDTIEKILKKRIKFYTKLNDEEKDELWSLLSNYEIYSINLELQKKIGFGHDKFSFNEFGAGYDISKYKHLKEWDKEQYTYQKKHGQTHLDDSYKIYLFGDWCRFVENKKLVYGMLLSLSSYIFEQVSEKLLKFESELYPHKVTTTSKKCKKKRINPLTKKKERFYTMDFTTKAYGKEKELKELQKFIRKFEHEILYPKIKNYVANHIKNRTYRVIDKKDTFDNFHQFLFSDKEALENCTFENFLNDFNALKRDTKDLKYIKKKFIKYAKEYILHNHFSQNHKKLDEKIDI